MTVRCRFVSLAMERVTTVVERTRTAGTAADLRSTFATKIQPLLSHEDNNARSRWLQHAFQHLKARIRKNTIRC